VSYEIFARYYKFTPAHTAFDAIYKIPAMKPTTFFGGWGRSGQASFWGWAKNWGAKNIFGAADYVTVHIVN